MARASFLPAGRTRDAATVLAEVIHDYLDACDGIVRFSFSLFLEFPLRFS